jgi:hypothetical protein
MISHSNSDSSSSSSSSGQQGVESGVYDVDDVLHPSLAAVVTKKPGYLHDIGGKQVSASSGASGVIELAVRPNLCVHLTGHFAGSFKLMTSVGCQHMLHMAADKPTPLQSWHGTQIRWCMHKIAV